MSHVAPIPARINGWDRAAVVVLGGAGCALSYDALQQMATAIHVRGLLTFVFPLVIDGFIAYGVRALLVLRTAPLPARCYVWTLFGTATAASIWANALHAVRLNQQQQDGAGLRLGDVTVGVLSTRAPLALAGAVHLYILIARRATEAGVSGHLGTSGVRTERVTEGRPDNYPGRGGQGRAPVTAGRTAESPSPDTARLAVTKGPAASETHALGSLSGEQEKLAEPEPEHGGRDADQGGHPAPRARPATRPDLAERPDTTPGATGLPDSGDRKPVAVTDEQLLVIARRAVTEAGDLTRRVVADAVRGQGHGLGNDRLTVLMQRLRVEAERAPDTLTGQPTRRGAPARPPDRRPRPAHDSLRPRRRTGAAIMRTPSATQAEADAWITVLSRYGHLHHAEPGPDEAWTVQRTATSTPRTLHHPVLALDFVAEVLRDVRRDTSGLPR